MRALKAAFAAISLAAAVTGGSVGIASTASAAPKTNCGHHHGYPPKHDDDVEISRSRVRHGERESFNSKCFKDKEKVRATVHSDPIVVGTWTASSSGVVSGSFTVPNSLKPGTHTLELRGLSSGITETASFVVVGGTTGTGASTGAGTGSKANGSLAFTGADVAGTVGAGLVLMLGGGALVVASQRRKHGSAA